MSNILRFRTSPRAVLNGGTVTKSDVPAQIGTLRYFIDYIDEEGGRLGVWDGSSYDEATDALAKWRQDGVRTVDLLGEALS